MSDKHVEIYVKAAQVADQATDNKYAQANMKPSAGNSVGDYWQMVFEATVAAALKIEKGIF